MVRFTPSRLIALALRLMGHKDGPVQEVPADRPPTQLELAPARGGFAGLDGGATAPGPWTRPAAGGDGRDTERMALYMADGEKSPEDLGEEVREADEQTREMVRDTIKAMADLTAKQMRELADQVADRDLSPETKEEIDRFIDEVLAESELRVEKVVDGLTGSKKRVASSTAGTEAAERIGKLADELKEHHEKRADRAEELRKMRKMVLATVKDLSLLTAARVEELSSYVEDEEPPAELAEQGKKAVDLKRKSISASSNAVAKGAKLLAKLADDISEQEKQGAATDAELRKIRNEAHQTVKDIATLTAKRVAELADGMKKEADKQ